MNKSLIFIFNFFDDHKTYKYIILISLLLVAFSGYLFINCLLDGIKILNYIEDQSKYNKAVDIVSIQTFKIIIIFIIFYCQPICLQLGLTRFFTYSLKYFLFKYLNVSQNLHKKLGPGKLRVILERKIFNTVEGIKIFIFDFWLSIVFFISASYVLFKIYNIYVFLYSILNGLLFCAILVPVASARNKFRIDYTKMYDQLIKSIYKVIINYEIIKANNKELDSIDQLSKDALNVKYFGIRNAFFTSLANFLTKSICELPNIIIYLLILNSNSKINIKTAVDFVLFKALSDSIKYRLFVSMTEYFKLNQYITDVINDDWDNIEYDIENTNMYLEYQNIKDKDKFIIKKSLEESSTKKISMDGYLPFIFEDKISFRDFSVSTGDRLLIKKSNFYIKKGEKVGLVGKNGTGKSTLLNILLRFRDYDGQIYIDKSEMRKCYKIDQRDKISYIQQDSGLLEGSILSNIIYNTRNIGNDKIEEICNNFNMSFPNLQVDVCENGRNLSGGQIKKISFLRGVVKNGDIFILDEPTSSFDNETEISLIESIHTKLQDKTVIAVLHKHSLLKSFDKILGIRDCDIKVYNSFNEFIEDSHFY